MTRCYLFDIDGTLADLTHRLPHIQKKPKDWDAFFAACLDDKPITHVVELARTLSYEEDIVFVSGRSNRVQHQTVRWLSDQGLPVHSTRLFMRRDGDHRPDHLVKAELLIAIREAGWEPIMAFDDRDQVVKMWRAAGIPCAQVAEGDF